MMNNLNITPQDTDESMNKYSVSFRIKNAPTLYQEISKLIKPNHIHYKGEQRYKTKMWNNDMWILESPLSTDCHYTEHIVWIWEKIKPHREYFKKLIEEGIEIDYFCSFTSDCDQDGFVLDKKFVETLSELPLPIEFSIIII